MARRRGTTPFPHKDHVWGHLDPRTQERLGHVLRTQIPEAFRKNRMIERQTGYVSEIGQQMMVDVLAHLSTLSRPDGLTPEKEASQVAKAEEHLRRAIIEHPEEVVRLRTGELNKLWVQYEREVFPVREEHGMHGAPRNSELEELRARISQRLEAARAGKPRESTWEESVELAGQVTEAADLTKELASKLDQCIGVAREYKEKKRREEDRAERERAAAAATAQQNRRTNRNWAISLGVTIAFGISAVIGTYFIADSDSKGQAPKTATPSTATQTAPLPPP